MNCRIVILNYNGRALLEECLPSIREAAANSSCKVTVLENGGADDSEAFVKRAYPEIDYVKSSSNKILCSYNEYLAQITEPYVILLNNDIKVDKNFITPLVQALEKDSNVFFAASKSLSLKDGSYEGSLTKMQFRWGLLWGTAHFKGYENKIDTKHLTMQCGYGAFRRDYFLALGGYDDLYLPGTIEDSDLCYRAYRRGWLGFYCPTSVVYHIGQASFKKEFGRQRIERFNRRNIYLFIWKNIESPSLWAIHLFFLPLHLVKDLLTGNTHRVLAFFDALQKMSEVRQRRKNALSKVRVRSDKAIFRISRSL